MAISTLGTVLKYGLASASATKMCPISSFPDLFGKPDKIETTTMDDVQKTYIQGIKDTPDMEFKANYDSATYNTLATNEGNAGNFSLEFGDSGTNGIFTWNGTYSLSISGAEVGAKVEMVITVYPSTVITKTTP